MLFYLVPQEATGNTGDPSGVPRPVAPDRIPAAKNNSGIIVGEQPVKVDTTSSTSQDAYKTAFIKVYQDAGVIGLTMLTLLVLVVIMALFSSRILKMYSALVSANTLLIQTQADATIKIAAAMQILQSTITSAMAEIGREHDEHVAAIRDLTQIIKSVETKADVMFTIVTRGVPPEERAAELKRIAGKDTQ